MLADPGLYVHFPWCVKKCPYCDFNSHPLRDQDDFQAYLACLYADLQQQADNTVFASVFFGGGTPSLFPPQAFAGLLQRIRLTSAAEVTMEANPGTTEHSDFGAYRRAGINRLSLGAQSFNNAHLQALGRIHSAEHIRTAYNAARQGGFDNINLDIMWGLPDQTPDQAMADLQAAIDLQPEHLSWYQLTLEPKTEFAHRPPILPVEADLAQTEAAGLAKLATAGYTRYEVSAYARAGARCRHNLNYWGFGDYIGIGAGAHGKISRANSVLRTLNPSQPRLYQRNPCQVQHTPIAAEQLPVEFMLNALRLVEGVGFDQFSRTTGLPWTAVQSTWARLLEQGLVAPDRCCTTPVGLRFLDTVISEFLPD